MTTWQEKLKSKWWRINNLYKIRDKQGIVQRFRPNNIQLQLIADKGSYRYCYFLKYRQGGITTFFAIDELDDALWVPGMSCGIIAHEAKRLPEYFNIVKRAFVNLPDRLKPKTKTDTKYMYEFVEDYAGRALDSSIYVATDIRGGTVQRLHITESAYIKDRQKLKAGSKQAVPVTGSITEETTGNGYNEFYDEFMQALENKSPSDQDYHSYFYPWVIQEEYTLPGIIEDHDKIEIAIKETAKRLYDIDVTDGQLLWRRWKKRELLSKQEGIGLSGDQLFKQEYPLTISEAFQSGDGNVFDAEKVDTIAPVEPMTKLQAEAQLQEYYPDQEKLAEKVKQLQSLFNKGFMFWEMPKPGVQYVLGCDPSDGSGSDNGAIDIWDDEALAQVAQFYGQSRPDELAELNAEIGYFYNEAFAGIENNMLSTVLFFIKIYSNYYFERRYDEKTQKQSKKLGWNTNTKTRDIMIDDYVIAFEEDSVTIRSKHTLREMKTFVRKENGKREHADGKTDDALFAAFIAIQMRKFNKPKVRTFEKKPF